MKGVPIQWPESHAAFKRKYENLVAATCLESRMHDAEEEAYRVSTTIHAPVRKDSGWLNYFQLTVFFSSCMKEKCCRLCIPDS
jgi:hypothetical protein